MDELTTDAATITRDVQSIRDVPDTHITPETRLALLKRAAAGEDVRAYGSVNSPTGIVNLWDWDTRIPFYPLAQHRWQLVRAAQSNIRVQSTLWELTFHPVAPGEDVRVLLYIERHPWEHDTTAYQERAGRVATMIEHYINLYRDEPAKYHGCHF